MIIQIMHVLRESGKAGKMGVAALISLMLLGGAVRGEERYYVIVFASQGDVNLPRFSHTFATFVKATGEGPFTAAYALEAHTISWSPASLAVRAARFIPEPGVNLNLAGSLRWAGLLDAHVSRWGPFEIRKELYDRALARIKFLESGAVEYKTLDAGLRPRLASNCIHAVCDLDAEDGLLHTHAKYGERASYHVAYYLRRWMIQPEKTHEWLFVRLGLAGLHIETRTWGSPPW